MRLRSLCLWVGLPLLFLGIAVVAGRVRTVESLYAALFGSPKLQIPSEISFGQRVEGDSVVVEIPLANRGGSSLLIHRFKTDCGCSGIQQKAGEGYSPISQLILQPGETQSVFLKFTIPVQSPPTIRHTVGFATNDPVHREASLQVVGNVVGKLISVPSRIILGAIPKNQPLDLQIELRDTGTNEDLSQLKAVCTLPGFHFHLDHDSSGMEKPTLGRLIGMLKISITNPNQLSVGHFDTTIDIVSSRDPNQRFLSIPISGEILPWFELRPSSILLPRRVGNEFLYESQFSIVCHTGQPATYRGISCPDPLYVEIANQPDEKTTFWKIRKDPVKSLTAGTYEVKIQSESGTVRQQLSLSVYVR